MSKIFITQFDLERLNGLLSRKKPHDDYDKALLEELSKAEVVDSKSIPDNVITMNSHIKFRDEDGNSRNFWLVFPEDADILENKVSVLSPIGCSLIGYKTGDSVTFPTPKGDHKFVVEEILYQPERAGDFSH